MISRLNGNKFEAIFDDGFYNLAYNVNIIKDRINYDFAAKFNVFAAKISPLIFNVFAVNF